MFFSNHKWKWSHFIFLTYSGHLGFKLMMKSISYGVWTNDSNLQMLSISRDHFYIIWWGNSSCSFWWFICWMCDWIDDKSIWGQFLLYKLVRKTFFRVVVVFQDTFIPVWVELFVLVVTSWINIDWYELNYVCSWWFLDWHSSIWVELFFSSWFWDGHSLIWIELLFLSVIFGLTLIDISWIMCLLGDFWIDTHWYELIY